MYKSVFHGEETPDTLGMGRKLYWELQLATSRSCFSCMLCAPDSMTPSLSVAICSFTWMLHPGAVRPAWESPTKIPADYFNVASPADFCWMF